MNLENWEDLKVLWRAKYSSARAFMEERAGNSRVLIEVAAQHPLTDGLYPNEEFQARLDRGKELFEMYSVEAGMVEIYVPGSRHVFEGRADRISLSEAGGRYLEQHGVPRRIIRGEDLNWRYKGKDGVYGSADECLVAASYFRDANYSTLASVVSPMQMLRKTLHYIEFGVVPLNYTVPILNAFHDYIEELFEQIPNVLSVDSTLQGDSAEAKRLREERKPKDGQYLGLPIQAVGYSKTGARQITFDICILEVLRPRCELRVRTPATSCTCCGFPESFASLVLLDVFVKAIRFAARATIRVTHFQPTNELAEYCD